MTTQNESAVPAAPRLLGFTQTTWHFLVSVVTLGLPLLAFMAASCLTPEQADILVDVTAAVTAVASIVFLVTIFVGAVPLAVTVAAGVTAGVTVAAAVAAASDVQWFTICTLAVTCALANLAVAKMFGEQ